MHAVTQASPHSQRMHTRQLAALCCCATNAAQVGNAVPPPVAYALGNELKCALERATRRNTASIDVWRQQSSHTCRNC